MELCDHPLEAELAEIADRAEPGRTARMAVRHWGWDGRGGATLATTGHEHGCITRERVRQLCERRELEAACLAAGVTPSSFNNRIAYSPVVTDLGQNRYALRGLRDGALWQRGPDAAGDAAGHAAPWLGDLVTSQPIRRR